MKLIVTEKNNTARRVSQILAHGGKVETKKSYKVPIYVFSDTQGEVRCIGLKGHILKVDFPPKYNSWQAVKPEALIDAQIIKTPTQKLIIKALKKEAKEASEVVVATDFDREGELIGVDAVNLVREVNPETKVKRARFSSLTPAEIEESFANLEEIYINLAQAGEARQDIDLIWGATLTRFLSLATGRLWKQFLSVGRVQSPTLCLIAAKERERQAFKSRPYWQIKALFRYQEEEFIAVHRQERFWDKMEAEKIFTSLSQEGLVTEVKRDQRSLRPPSPFNTTSFLAAATGVRFSTAAAMRIAENLYMEGLVSYPRVDNTVYPPSLSLREILQKLQESPELGHSAGEILAQEKTVPTRGKKKATDHPPIHPTAAASKETLGARNWRIYELIVRRFMATLAPSASVEGTRIDIEAGGQPFLVKGSRTVKEGWLRYYPYGRRKDEELPLLEKGAKLELVEPILEEKQTQPPSRYSQGRLIQRMEQLGLGTKSTRHEIIKSLYDRGYAHGEPIIPTEMGLAVAGALAKYAEEISSPQMTAELEKDMDSIAVGQALRQKVVDRSRGMLAGVMLNLKQKKEEVRNQIHEGIREGRAVGRCPNCGGDLRVIRAKKSRKRFIGCSGYPDCRTAYPLPQYGEIVPLKDECQVCKLPKIKVLSRKPWVLCINPDCPSKKASKERGLSKPGSEEKAALSKDKGRKAK